MTAAIDFEAIPGNSHLVNFNEKKKDGDRQGKIVFIPTPSDDPDDPLNWTPLRKWTAVACVLVYTLGACIPTAAIYSVLPNIEANTTITLSELNNGTGYMFLFLGIGCLVFQPLALQYGKRPVYLFSMLATAMICVWPPYTKSNGEWIASKILQGFVGSSMESLPEISMSDLFFEHERSFALSLYGLTLLCASFLAPFVAGFISEGQGWEWVMWWCAIFGAVCFLFLFFFMEETNYDRKLKVDATTGEVITLASRQQQLGSVFTNIDEVMGHNSKADQLGEKNESQSNAMDASSHTDDYTENVNIVNQTSNVEVVNSNYYAPAYHGTKTYWQKLSLFSGRRKKFLLQHYAFAPFLMVRFPVVVWAGFLYGSSLVWFNVLNATAALILGGSPYNFSSSIVGVAYLSPTTFSVILFFMSGMCSDWLKVRIALWRGTGLSKPEDRLWILLLYCILGCFACILWGVGAYYEIHWFGLVFGMGLLGGCGIFAIASSATYVVDTYKELDTEAMVVVILIRNCMSFAVSYGITDWVTDLGYKRCFISVAFLCLAANLTFLPMVFFGPWIRNRQKHMYWSMVDKYRKLGMH
ncbi:LANO_0H25246g1_1 [Lachancea nothofagi CBS 11611]|uniref:LANO_0H25246g1_1 n=1 Tax=Lachancea nothofagi CBS 11611 TaxID=1266666 RepID=A0A1G4KNX6_9SACH|nr:LANO_0H25246g1_1 [Lachancea nothofagi CBS 11611]